MPLTDGWSQNEQIIRQGIDIGLRNLIVEYETVPIIITGDMYDLARRRCNVLVAR